MLTDHLGRAGEQKILPQDGDYGKISGQEARERLAPQWFLED